MTGEVVPVLEILEGKRDAIAELCVRYGVARLDVFGSVLRDDYRPGESDIDFLVVFAPHEGYDLVDAYFRLLEGLRLLLGRVDLVMADAVTNPYIARAIEREKRPLYAA